MEQRRRRHRKSRRRPNAAAAAASPSPPLPPRRSKWTVAIVATLSLSTIASIARAEGEVDYQDCWDALWDADVQHGNSDGKVKEDEYPRFVQDLDDLYNPGDNYFDDMDSFNELPILLTTKFREIACDSIGSCFGSNAGLDAVLADPRGRPDDDETTYLNELCRDVLSTMELVKTPAPSRPPTKAPTTSPKPTPVGGPVPTELPTSVPTEIPTKSPTGSPSVPPTGVPTFSPTSAPSGLPTSVPTSNPTAVPSYSPSESPIDGTAAPSLPTTSRPSDAPSLRPSSGPTDASDRSPSSSPTAVPTPGPSIPPTSPPMVDSDVSYTGPLTVNVSFVISSQGLTAESVKLGNIIVSKLEGALTKLATRVFLTEVSLRSLLRSSSSATTTSALEGGNGVRGRRKLSSVTYDPTNNPATITSVTDVNCPSSVLDGTLTCQICEATIVLDAIDVPRTSKTNEVQSKLQDEIDFGFLGSQLESDDPNSLVSVLKVREGPAPTASPAPSAMPSAAPKPPTKPEPALKAQEESDDSSGGLPTGAIVGIAVGCVALAGAALYGLLYTKRKNRAVSKSRKGRKKRENVELSSDNGSWRDEPGDNSKTHLVGAVPATYGDSDRNMLTTIDGVPSPEQSQSKESAAAAQAAPTSRGAAPPAVAPAPENDARGSSQAGAGGSRSVSSGGYSAGSDPHLTIDKILAQPSPSSDDQESYASSSGAGSSGWSSSLGGSSSTITGQSSITGSGVEAAAAAAAVAAAQQQQQREQERERTELDSLVSDMDKSNALPVITDDDTDTDDDTEEDDSTYESDSFLEGTSTATDDDVEEEEEEDDSTYHTEDYTEGSYTQATPSLDAAAVLSSEPQSDPRNALDAAIEAGDWAAVGATAALLASATEDRTEGQSTASGSRSQSFGYVGSGRAATQETDDGGTAGGGTLDADRAAELEYLVEAGDWEGVVSAAARFEALSEVERAEHDESTDLTGADGYMGSESSRHDEDATSTSDDRSHTSDDYGDSTDFTTDDDDEEETGDSMGSSYYSAGASTQTSVSLSAEDLSPEERRHRAEVRAEVEALVRIVVPEEVDNVDVMMMQFKGREDELLSTLRTMQSRSVTQRARASVHKSHKRAAAVSVDGGSGHTPGGASVASRSVGSASSAGSRSRHSQSQGGAGSVLSNPPGATAPYSRTQGMYDARHPSEDTFNSFGDTTYGDTIHSGGNASSENESYGFSDPELRSTRRDQNNLNAVSRGAELPPMLASMARASLNQQNSGSNPNSRPGSAGGGSGPNSRPGSAGSRPGSGENSIGKEGGVVFMDTDEESDDFREQH